MKYRDIAEIPTAEMLCDRQASVAELVVLNKLLNLLGDDDDKTGELRRHLNERIEGNQKIIAAIDDELIKRGIGLA